MPRTLMPIMETFDPIVLGMAARERLCSLFQSSSASVSAVVHALFGLCLVGERIV